MSTTRSLSALDIVADALIGEAASSSAHRRLYLGPRFGLDAGELLETLLERTSGELHAGGGLPVLKTVPAGDATLIPYLVVPRGESGQNRGTQGFVARLRTDFLKDAPEDEVRVLLVLDPNPVETYRSAAEDAGTLPRLSWPELCARAAATAADESPAREIATALAADVGKHRGSIDLLERLTAFCSRDWPSSENAGEALVELDFYLRDPEVATEPAARLARAARWRRDLERWSAPDEDIVRRLERKLGATAEEAITKVTAAVTPFGIDYRGFTLADLDEPRRRRPPRLRRPLQARGGTSSLSSGDALAIWLPGGGGSVTLRTDGDLDGDERVEVRWGGGEVTAADVADDGTAELAIAHEGWRFGWLVLARGEATLDLAPVASYCAGGTWFPVERAFLIDVEAGAFRVEGELAGLAVAPGGAVLGPVTLHVDDVGPEQPEEPIMATGTRQNEEHAIPVLLTGEDAPGGDGGEEPGEDESDDGGEGDAGEEDEGDEDGEGRDRAGRAVAASPVHAFLDAVRSDPETPAPEVSFRAEGGVASLTAGGAIYTFASQRIGRFEGLALEEAILSRPEIWAFTASVAGERLELREDPLLERLSLARLDGAAVREFEAARAALFAALRERGSAYAIGTGDAKEEATRYVVAYARLLAAIPRSDRHQPEYDRCLLVDCVVDTATGDRFLGPTNPVTVAFYLAFAEAARVWSAAAPAELLEQDERSIVADHLLPLVMAAGQWYEAVPVAPFLWRQLQPVRERGGIPGDEARLIADRLRFFLTVHEAYDDPEQTLSVSIIEPGDGGEVVDALRRFYRLDYGKEEYRRPRLDVHLISADGVPSAIDDLLASGDDADPRDRLIRSRVRVSAQPPQSALPFSHLTFVFRTPSDRRPAEVKMESRASSLYVGGLATAPGRAVEEGENQRSFSWGTFASKACGDVPAGRAGELLPGLVRGTLELVGGQPRELLQQQVTRMATTVVETAFMREEYAKSVWVVHLDHVLGLEAFAPGVGGSERYLIDYEDRGQSFGSALGGVTATSRIEPYRDVLTHALADLGQLERQGLERILRLLNSVSGRWALRLLQDPYLKIRERIGTVAAIAMLEELDRAFDRDGGTGLLVPLDELFERLPAQGIARPDVRSTDDLLYVFVPHAPSPVLRARLLEVKYRTTGGPELAEARQEIENTEGWLDAVFNDTGPGRLFRSRDFAELLRTSAARASAFGLAGRRDRAGLETALEGVASGDFRLEFRYWVGGEELAGDVISVELESEIAASRASLPGAGRTAGVVRLGRPVLTALAAGQAMPLPPEWQRPEFEPPADAGPPAGGDAPDGGGPDGGSEPPVGDDSGGGGAAPAAAAPAEPSAHAVAEEEVRRLARELDGAVLKYNLELEPFQVALAQIGPSVIRFRARPLGRQSLEGISRRAADIGREIGVAEGVLVGQEPYYITIDVPRRERQVIRFRDYAHLLGEPEPGALKFLVGMAASGEVTVADLARLPHLLIAGATGSGKSVFLRSLMCSLLEQHGAMDLSILLVDPKQLDFLPFEELPHLVDSRIIFDPAEAVAALAELIDREIDKRRPLLKRAGASNILEYYEAGHSPQELQQIVIVVDEFADLASTLGRGERAEFMNLIQRYGQMTRAYGIYLVLATQRPSVQVITGDIKANLTARVALKVQAPQDSVTILGHGGAESLRDKGDLLFEHGGATERLQGFMVTPSDVGEAVGKWSRP